MEVNWGSHGKLHWHPHALKTPDSRLRNARLPLGSLQVLGVDFRNQHPSSLRLSVLVEHLPGGDVQVSVVEMDGLQVLGRREF